MHTFDGRGYSFQGQGEFLAYETKDHNEWVTLYQARKEDVGYNLGVAFRSFGETFAVHIPRSKSDNGEFEFHPFVRWNNHEITRGVLGEAQTRAGHFYITHEGRLDDTSTFPFVMTVSSPNATALTIIFIRSRNIIHLDVFIETPSARFGETSGLCGLFNLRAEDDMMTPSGEVETNAEKLALKWSLLESDKKSLWASYITFPKTELVSEKVITPKDIGKDRDAVLNASLACAGISSDFRTPCMFNQMMAGNSAVHEANQVEHVAMENGVIGSGLTRECFQGSWTMAEWHPWSKCSAQCGLGTHERNRTVLSISPKGDVVTPCGNITQVGQCESYCSTLLLFIIIIIYLFIFHIRFFFCWLFFLVSRSSSASPHCYVRFPFFSFCLLSFFLSFRSFLFFC